MLSKRPKVVFLNSLLLLTWLKDFVERRMINKGEMQRRLQIRSHNGGGAASSMPRRFSPVLFVPSSQLA